MAISRDPRQHCAQYQGALAAYAPLFGVKYSPKANISLLPLTVGVMLASTFDPSASSPGGVLCAFSSALVSVSSNLYSRKVVRCGSQASSRRLDKVDMLFYSSRPSFSWYPSGCSRTYLVFSNPTHIVHPNRGHSTIHSPTYYFTINGLVHFAQNIIDFVILPSTSPVIGQTDMGHMYGNLVQQRIHPMQGIGIGLTFIGLYVSAKSDIEKGEIKVRRVEATRDMVLSNRAEEQLLNGSSPPSPIWTKPPAGVVRLG